VRVVPNGVDVTRFEGHDRDAALERYGRGPWLVFVGRLRYYKGLSVLIDALARVPDAGLLLVGTGPEGASLRAQADRVGVSERVRWLGDVTDDELPQVLAAGDVFVLPSIARSEAFGVAMVEAMAAGLACVSTELGTGTSWVNQDGVTGLVVPHGRPDALADAVTHLLGDDRERQRMGDAARRRAHERFTDEAMVSNVAAVYEEAMA
jgi:rhamnosyl/mannosyltransferase